MPSMMLVSSPWVPRSPCPALPWLGSLWSASNGWLLRIAPSHFSTRNNTTKKHNNALSQCSPFNTCHQTHVFFNAYQTMNWHPTLTYSMQVIHWLQGLLLLLPTVGESTLHGRMPYNRHPTTMAYNGCWSNVNLRCRTSIYACFATHRWTFGLYPK